MSGVEYIKSDLSKHPQCVHGPTFLFSRNIKGGESRFFACSACRDRKDCPFFLREGEKYNNEIMKQKQVNFAAHVNHEQSRQLFEKICKMPEQERKYCQKCNTFIIDEFKKHEYHDIIEELSDEQLNCPSLWLQPKENDKKEAQYLFSQSTVATIINILKDQKIKNVLCIGTPRIHEYIRSNCKDMKSFLLDIEERYHNFYKPEEFCWYNLFNHYFFIPKAKQHYINFIRDSSAQNIAVLIDPPFGGRTEPISQTIEKINEEIINIDTDSNKQLSILFFMPYFLEQHIKNHLPNLLMADFKVDYDNHSSFSNGPKSRKLGSPVRIFTNINLSNLIFYSDDYNYCDICEKYVYKENKHCYLCNSCTSKDGSTYVHCNKCNRCVKPTWVHCIECKKCKQKDHKCGEEIFDQSCFHCHEKGHKRSQCPNIDQKNKRKKKGSIKKNKKLKTEIDK